MTVIQNSVMSTFINTPWNSKGLLWIKQDPVSHTKGVVNTKSNWKSIQNIKLKERETLTLSGAIGRIFEEGERKLLVRNSDIDEYEPRRGIVDDDVFDREPEEELLLREPLNAGEAAVGEISPDLALVEGHGVEFGQTRAVEEDLEQARAREGVGLDLFGEQARREAHGFKEVVDGCGGVREWEREKEEEEEEREKGLISCEGHFLFRRKKRGKGISDWEV